MFDKYFLDHVVFLRFYKDFPDLRFFVKDFPDLRYFFKNFPELSSNLKVAIKRLILQVLFALS